MYNNNGSTIIALYRIYENMYGIEYAVVKSKIVLDDKRARKIDAPRWRCRQWPILFCILFYLPKGCMHIAYTRPPYCVSVYHFMTDVGHLILWHFENIRLTYYTHTHTHPFIYTHSQTNRFTFTETRTLHYFNALSRLLNSSSRHHHQLCYAVQIAE